MVDLSAPRTLHPRYRVIVQFDKDQGYKESERIYRAGMSSRSKDEREKSASAGPAAILYEIARRLRPDQESHYRFCYTNLPDPDPLESRNMQEFLRFYNMLEPEQPHLMDVFTREDKNSYRIIFEGPDNPTTPELVRKSVDIALQLNGQSLSNAQDWNNDIVPKGGKVIKATGIDIMMGQRR